MNMKINKVITFGVGLMLAGSLSVNAQKVTFNGERVSLKQAFQKIESVSKYKIAYNATQLDVNKIVTLNQKNVDVLKVLDAILAGTDCTYKINDGYIVITPIRKETENVVEGTVKDEKGEPIIGATVMVKGTNTGTITDFDGKFSLNVEDGTNLEISYIGYQSRQIKAMKRKSLTVVLREDTEMLDEVVVVGYGSQKRKEITGSVSSMKMNELPATGASSVTQLLSGRAAGLNTNIASAQPGGKVDLRIRGTATGKAPLIVIDGFPVSNFDNASAGMYQSGSTDAILASINPNDIASIDILKDASATSVYGTRAAGGVILITTKRGRTGKTSVEFNGSLMFSKAYGYPKLLNAKDYMLEANRMYKESFMYNNGVGVYGDKEWEDVAADYKPLYSNEEIAKFENNPGTNWVDEIMRTGIIQNYGVSISGGNENTKYFTSLGYYGNQGIIKNNNYNKYTGQINIDQKFSKKISGGLSLNLSRVNMDNVPLQDGYAGESDIFRTAFQYAPIYSIKDDEGNYSLMPSASFLSNPVSLLDISSNTRTDRVLGNLFLVWDIIDGLRLKGVIGADINYSQANSYIPSTTVAGASANGKADKVLRTKDDYQAQLLATYNKMFKNKHELGLMFGTEYVQSNWSGFNAGNQDFTTDGFLWNNLGMGAFKTPTVGSYGGKSETLSYVGRVNYNYNQRYYVTANIRIDGSSNFAANHQWGFFPGISLGWDLARESFMERMLDTVDQLKLRVGYGQTGNDDIGSAFFNYYAPGNKVLWGDQVISSIQLAGLGNPDLKWETQTDFNVGIDFSFFKGRLTGSFEYFNRVISDILGKKQLSSIGEVTELAYNLDAKKQTYGYELSLFSKNIDNNNFKWNTSFTFSYYRDRWLKRDSSWKPDINDSEKAYFDELWYYISDGFFKEGDTFGVNENNEPITMIPGTVKIKDIDGYLLDDEGKRVLDENGKPMRTGQPDGKIDKADMVKLGVNAPFTIGLTNSFNYKNFDLGFTFYGKFNSWKVNSMAQLLTEAKLLNEQGMNMSYDVRDVWTSDNQNAKYPSVLQNRSKINGGVGDIYLQKAWFIRLSNIDLGYTFNLQKYHIDNLRLYVSLQNPFVITPYKGMDPETDNRAASYPNQRNYAFGVQIRF